MCFLWLDVIRFFSLCLCGCGLQDTEEVEYRAEQMDVYQSQPSPSHQPLSPLASRVSMLLTEAPCNVEIIFASFVNLFICLFVYLLVLVYSQSKSHSNQS